MKDFNALLAKMPTAVQEEYAKMKPSLQEAFRTDYLNNAKCIKTAYLAGLFFGAQYLYCKKIGQQALLWGLLGIAFTYFMLLPAHISIYLNVRNWYEKNSLPFIIWLVILGCFSLFAIGWWIFSIINMSKFIENYNREQSLISLDNINRLKIKN